MNNLRRKEIRKALSLLEQAKAILDDCQYDEESARDNMPESMWDSERFQVMDSWVDAITDVTYDLESDINNLTDKLEGGE